VIGEGYRYSLAGDSKDGRAESVGQVERRVQEGFGRIWGKGRWRRNGKSHGQWQAFRLGTRAMEGGHWRVGELLGLAQVLGWQVRAG
jgi:hypothetical protein